MSTDGIDFKELKRRARDKPDYDVELDDATDQAGEQRARPAEEPLDLLHRRGSITQRQYDAGARLRGLCGAAAAQLACPPYDGTPAPESYGPRTMPIKVIQANADLAHAVQKIGIRVSTPLIMVCHYAEPVHAAYGAKTTTSGRRRSACSKHTWIFWGTLLA